MVSGIWPPDVGGPASHAPEVVAELVGRGHEVVVVTTASRPPGPTPYPVHWAPRALPVGARHLAAAGLIARHAREADVVYCTGMFARTAAAAAATRRPLVMKLTGDPAFERARARGLPGSPEGFAARRDPAAVALRLLRRATLRPARHLLCPSSYLRDMLVGWGVEPRRVSVLPNPHPFPIARDRDELRRRLGLHGPTLAFAGRLTVQKNVPLAIEALARLPGVRLAVVGDGPERAAIEDAAVSFGVRDRVELLGALPRSEALDVVAAADLAVLPSRWENFPHAVVEALSVGTPVVATPVGGVTEVVCDGRNGVLVPSGDALALAAAVRALLADDGARARLAAAAPGSVARYAPGPTYDRLERILRGAAG